MAGTNSVFANDTSIVLDWANVSGANLYHLQVSEFPDFASLIVDDNTLVLSTASFTDVGSNDAKRYWRWRSSSDSGTNWTSWSEVGSYWLNTSGGGDVTLAANKWAIFDPDAVTDIFTFSDYPVYAIIDMAIYRVQERNRAGLLLSEYLTHKAKISLEFGDQAFITHEQMRELKRFNAEVKTFFLATYKTNGVDTVPNIWKVQFIEDPEFSMLAMGREDFFTGVLTLEEV